MNNDKLHNIATNEMEKFVNTIYIKNIPISKYDLICFSSAGFKKGYKYNETKLNEAKEIIKSFLDSDFDDEEIRLKAINFLY